MKIRHIITISAAILMLSSCNGGNKSEVTTKELYGHISYLASDELAGRLTGTEGDSLAAVYIRNQFTAAGLVSVTGDGFQRFEVTSDLVATDKNFLEVAGKVLTQGVDFTPLSISANGTASGEVVFAGYGFDINTDTLVWNDYEGLDVNGKWVLVLRADPEVENNASNFASVSTDRYKTMIARDKGAAGIIFISGEKYDPKDEFEILKKGEFSAGIPVIRIKRNVASQFLGNHGSSIEDIEQMINDNRKPAGFATGIGVNATADIERKNNTTRNVIMMLPGYDPELKDEYVIIGAHFDHLGMGGEGSGSRATDTIAPHYGADDNASGVAMMIEIAEKFSSLPKGNARSIVFIAFTGEEMGLLGSKYFVENSLVDLKSVNAMINLDMVGRLKEQSVLQISGVGTSPGLEGLLNSQTDTSLLKLALSNEGYGPSDHSSFYGKDIPVISLTTGAHMDYHTPSDNKERINYEGMITVSEYLFRITDSVVNGSEKLTFTEAGPKDGGARGSRRKGMSLGIMPDFAGNVTDGLRADFVTPGKPAAIGGMLKGDIIKSINGKTVKNIEDYMFRLNQLKPGEIVTVEVLRGEKTELLILQL